MIKATAWVVIEAKKTSTYPPPSGSWGAKIKQVMQSKPQLAANQVAMELEIEFPDDYFADSNPKIMVTVPSLPAAAKNITTTAKVTKGRAPSAAAKVVHP